MRPVPLGATGARSVSPTLDHTAHAAGNVGVEAVATVAMILWIEETCAEPMPEGSRAGSGGWPEIGNGRFILLDVRERGADDSSARNPISARSGPENSLTPEESERRPACCRAGCRGRVGES